MTEHGCALLEVTLKQEIKAWGLEIREELEFLPNAGQYRHEGRIMSDLERLVLRAPSLAQSRYSLNIC